MLTILLSISLMLFFAMLTCPNPLSTALYLVASALVLGAMIWLMASKWLALAIALVFVGGMMVVFLYVTSLSINLKFKLHWTLPVCFALLLILFSSLHLTFTPSSLFPAELYSPLSAPNLLFLIVYLLLCMFIIVKLCECLKGALSQKF